ncbi:hypothetical protein WDV93_00845 [Pantoea ananatis]
MLEASEQLGFRPNHIARQLWQSSTLGVLLPSLSNPVFALQLQAMEQQARLAAMACWWPRLITTECVAAMIEHMLRQRVAAWC